MIDRSIEKLTEQASIFECWLFFLFLSAIPQPDPVAERHKKLLVYDPACHHYGPGNQPAWREAFPGHFVLADDAEFAQYQRQYA